MKEGKPPKPSKPSTEGATGRQEQKLLQSMMKVLKLIHSVSDADSTEPQALARQRRGHELLGRFVTPMVGMEWEPFSLSGPGGDLPAAWTRPDSGYSRRHAILYCHGGGYTSGALNYARILSSKLSHATGWPVLSFQYRLAPEHPYPAALEDALAAWDHLMYHGYGARDVVVAGDSAGGNLSLCLTLRLREMERLLPRALILMSPWTDLAAQGKSYRENVEADPILTPEYIQGVRTAYAGADADWLDPHLSPLYASLQGFPPTLVQVGTNELLESDSVRLRDRLVMAGVPCRLEVWRDMWHVFQMFPLRQAGQAMDSIGRFLLELA